MSCRAAQCRQKALQLEQAATIATDPNPHEIYIELARQWRDMADYFDEIEQGLAERSPASRS